MSPVPPTAIEATAVQPRPASPPITGAARQLTRLILAGGVALLVERGVSEASATSITTELAPMISLTIVMPGLAWIGKLAREKGGWAGKILGKFL